MLLLVVVLLVVWLLIVLLVVVLLSLLVLLLIVLQVVVMLTVGCWSASCLYGADCYVIISCEADHAVVRLHQVTAGHEPEGIDIFQNVLHTT